MHDITLSSPSFLIPALQQSLNDFATALVEIPVPADAPQLPPLPDGYTRWACFEWKEEFPTLRVAEYSTDYRCYYLSGRWIEIRTLSHSFVHIVAVP